MKFNFNTEDYLYKLDQAFADKDEKEVYMIYFLSKMDFLKACQEIIGYRCNPHCNND